MKSRMTLLLLLVLLLAVPPLVAGPGRGPVPREHHGLRERQAAPPSGVEEAIRRAREHTRGRILAAEPAWGEDGRRVWRVKVLTPDNRVRILEYPAP